MAPSLMLVLLAIAVARAELITDDGVVRFVQSKCVFIGVAAQETCDNCKRACRPFLELGEYCEVFCEDKGTDKCDVLRKFRPGDAARYNDTAEDYCGSNELTEFCRILRYLRDAALHLESYNPCVSAAASGEEDDTSKDKDVCLELQKDSKSLVLCKPSDITNEKEEAPRGAAAADGHIPLSRDDTEGSGGHQRPRRAASKDTTPPVLAPTFDFSEQDPNCNGHCKESCAEDERLTWHTCVSGGSCCYPLEKHPELLGSTDNDTSDAVADRLSMRDLFGIIDLSGTLTSDEAPPFHEIPLRDVFASDEGKICETTGTCKGKCEDVMEVELSWYRCEATDETCCFVAGQ